MRSPKPSGALVPHVCAGSACLRQARFPICRASKFAVVVCALAATLATLGTASSDGTRTEHCTEDSVAVTGVASTPSAELISDCNILLDAKETLQGPEGLSLNWSADLDMNQWTAIEISAMRVTKLDTGLDDVQTIFTDSLRGELPSELGDLSALTTLRLTGVALRGEIPEQLGNLSQLTTLNLSATRCTLFAFCGGLEGSIPEALGNLERLEVLNLSENKLVGEVPLSLRKLTALRVLDLGGNVDTNFLLQPVLPATGLEGEIPISMLTELHDLNKLDLSFNRLTGGVPRELGELESLDTLHLHRNFLTGCIPRALEQHANPGSFRGINPQRNTTDHLTRDLFVCPTPDRPVASVVRARGGEMVVSYRADSAGEPVTRFEYRLSADGGSTWNPNWTAIPDSAPGEANAGSFTIGGLTDDTTYTLELRAVNVDGIGPATSITATLESYPDTALSDLVLRHGTTALTLSPVFAFDRFSYTAMVGNSVDSLTIIATPASGAATVSSDPEDDDGTEGVQVGLDVGFNTIVLTVTTGNGDRQVYRLTVVRNPTDEPAGVTVEPTELSLDEGTMATYTVVLAAEPVEAVTVGIRLTGSRSVRANPSRLTFQTSNWDTPQTVTVRAATDADDSDERAMLSHFATGAGYDTVSMPVVAITARDDNGAWVPTAVAIEAQAGNSNVVVVYDGKLDETSLPALEDFEVRLDGEVVAVESLTVSGMRVTLTLERAPEAGQRVDVSVVRGAVRGVPEVGSETPSEPVLLFESASNPDRQGFVRVINHSDRDGEVRIAAIDDAGVRSESISLAIAAGGAAHFNADDLETGSATKGLPDGVGSGSLGDWRLELASALDIEMLSYARTTDGFVTSLHDSVAAGPGAPGEAVFFNPGKNVNQVSRLRLVNAEKTDATVTIQGTDDAGMVSGEVRIEVHAGSSVNLTAAELESGIGHGILNGALAAGTGKWRLSIDSDVTVTAMSLLESQGRLTNLSTAPQTEGSTEGSILVSLFPSASNPDLEGFVRVINRSAEAGEVSIEAFDDTDRDYETVTLSLESHETRHFNSDDVELGNADKKLTGSTGAGEGDWRLELTSDLDIDVLAYIRTDDGFVTAMHDLAPIADDVHRVVFLNPAKNQAQVSRIRLVNPGTTDATVTITGIDSEGESPGDAVQATVPAGASLQLTAQELESGDSDNIDSGALGTGQGKWRLQVASDQAIHVMSLLESPTGHLTNLSTSPGAP